MTISHPSKTYTSYHHITMHDSYFFDAILLCLLQGIAIRVASPKLVMEEAPQSYKDVCQVNN